jgi:peptide/nickel transport system permease protein
MIAIVIRRLLISFVVIAMVSVISFAMITLTPGSPFPWGDLNPQIAPAVKAEYRKRFHLDQPWHAQYRLIIADLFTGRLASMKDGRSVLAKIADRFPATLFLAATALVFIYGFGIVIGINAAIHHRQWIDRAWTLATFAGIALPSFWIGYLVILLLARIVHAPVLGTVTLGAENSSMLNALLDRLWHLLVPAAVLALPAIATQARYLRASLLDVLETDYIRTARAKGAPADNVIYGHALRNAVRPLITNFGILLPALLGGSIIVETIFAWPGIGRLAYEAVLERDYPVLVALNLVTALVVVLAAIVSDLVNAWADPRLRRS